MKFYLLRISFSKDFFCPQSFPAESDVTPFEEVCILFHVASSQKAIWFPCRNSHFKDFLLFDTIMNLLISLLESIFSSRKLDQDQWD